MEVEGSGRQLRNLTLDDKMSVRKFTFFLFKKTQICDKHCNFLHPLLFHEKPEMKGDVNLYA